MMQKIQEIVKELAKYADDLQKKYKTVKDEEAGTLEVVQLIQVTTLSAQKAKEVYFQRASELEKLQKDNASQKDIEKAEVKTKKAYEDYKTWVEKYSVCRDDFERKMMLACKVLNWWVKNSKFLTYFALTIFEIVIHSIFKTWRPLICFKWRSFWIPMHL